VKSEYKEVDFCENSRAVHLSLHNSETVIPVDSEKSSINANRKSTMSFPTNHLIPRSCVIPNVPKIGLRYQNLSFFAEISTKNHQKATATKFHCLKTSSGKDVAQSVTNINELPIERYRHFVRR